MGYNSKASKERFNNMEKILNRFFTYPLYIIPCQSLQI